MHDGFCGNLSRSETSNSVAYVTSSSDYVPSVCSICAFCFADSQPPDASGLSGWMRDPDRSVRMLWAPQFLAQQGTRTPRVRMARDTGHTQHLLSRTRILFLHSHLGTDHYFAASGVVHAQHNQDQFRFHRSAFYPQLKSKVGNILAKATAPAYQP